MLILISLLQLMIFISYVQYIKNKYGVLTSISASTYSLKGQKRWYFLGFLWSIALLNLFQGMEVYGFVTTVGLCFSGITIDHESDAAHADKVHTAGTVIAIISAFIGLGILHGSWEYGIIFMIFTFFMIEHEKGIWYIEIVAMGLIIMAYLLR